MKPDIVLKAGTLAGKILLENGAETVRVEETVTRICESFLASDANAFATPTGLFVSFDYEDQTYAKVLRIKGTLIHLERINQVNAISRRCAAGELDEVETYEQLKQVRDYVGYSWPTKLIASGFAAMFFTYIFDGSFLDGVCAFFIGIVTQAIAIKMDEKDINSIVKITILSAFITCITLIMSTIGLVESKDNTIIGGLMLLVPGVAITNAVRDSIAGDLLSGITRAIEAFLIAIAIAVGVGAVLTLWMTYIGGGV